MTAVTFRPSDLNLNFDYPKMHIKFTTEQKISTEMLARNAEQIFKKNSPEKWGKTKDGKIEIHIISDQEIQELNKDHRGQDKPTDVLSWGFIDENLMAGEIIGEIYISNETAERQAQEKGHTLEDEILFLSAHGLLHIYGYDHETDEEEAEMDKLTEQLIAE